MTAATTLYNVGIFDGTSLISSTAVRFVDGVIIEVADSASARHGDEVVDGEGGLLLPGLIDAHTHVLPGALEQALTFGVTTELDMFAKPSLVRNLKQRARHNMAMSDLRSSGIGATAPGGHPSRMYAPFPYATGPAQADRFVADRIAEGSDYLKVFCHQEGASPTLLPTLSPDTVRALVRAAHQRNLAVVAHATSLGAARTAVEAGADGLAHIPIHQLVDETFVHRLLDRGVTVTPTLAAIENALGRQGGALVAADVHLSPYLGHGWRQILALASSGQLDPDLPDYAIAQHNVGTLVSSGVTVLAGTDAPNLGTAHGASLHRELELFVEAGMPAEQALKAATSVPADVYGLSDRGRIAPGKRADLVLVDGDPVMRITDTRKIKGVWRGGVPYDRSRFAGSKPERDLIDALRTHIERAVNAAERAPDAPMKRFKCRLPTMNSPTLDSVA